MWPAIVIELMALIAVIARYHLFVMGYCTELILKWHAESGTSVTHNHFTALFPGPPK